MLKLGIDIDGTIKNTHQAAVTAYNRELQRNVSLEEVKDFFLDEAYGLTPEEGRKMWRKLEAEIYTLGVPLPHAQEVLQQLQEEGHEIYFITARPGIPKVVEVTKQWLRKHGFPYNGENLMVNSLDKGKVAKKLGIDLFFEDAPNHLERLQEMQIPTVIVDASYNRSQSFEMPRIHDWLEVPELITKYR